MVDSIPLLSHIFLLLCTMATAMVATASTALPPTSPSCSLTRPPLVSCSALVIPRPRCPKIHLVVSIPQEGSRRLGPWSGLKNLGITCRHRKRVARGKWLGFLGSGFGYVFRFTGRWVPCGSSADFVLEDVD
ncbi:hypothetical protein Taro_040830 [Colocasia esculenta]|uniref:Uncharacterized protein n=1 Tax=Colocasia esculenta TaxID=4460 RepID=A0A843W9Y6_COLES|nr:hypothetical protein [Colocasia esculenta]